jgi:hypothetical protein
MMRSASKTRDRRSEAGWSMIELIVAIAVSALILAGTIVLLRYTVMVGAEHRHKTMATLQVQYVGFWVSEDVMQAQEIVLSEPDGFPLQIAWMEEDEEGEYFVENVVTYELNAEARCLERTHTLDGVSLGTSVVGEFLEPESTRCYENEFEYVSSLILEVTANCEGGEATSTYEIHPRAYVPRPWLPVEA